MKIALIVYVAMLPFAYLMLNRDKEWVRWIGHSLTIRRRIRAFKLGLESLDKLDRILYLVDWLDAEFWHSKHWFGRKLRREVIKELEKLTK